MNGIQIQDLRKGNFVQSEYGIVRVHHICFGDVYVSGGDGRILYARDVNGIPAKGFCLGQTAINQLDRMLRVNFKSVDQADGGIEFIHEVQNWYYWNSGKKELEIEF